MIYKWYQFVERVNEAEIAVNPPTTGAEIVSGQTPTTSTATQSTTSSSVQNDKNSEAAKAFKDSVVDPSIRIINTLQEKIDASKLDQDAKDHLNKECRRIKGSKSGFLYSIVNKMTGYFQGTDDVEIQISSSDSDGSYRTFVEIDTDF